MLRFVFLTTIAVLIGAHCAWAGTPDRSSVNGRVIDESGNPISGVTVTENRRFMQSRIPMIIHYPAVSDDAGRFSLEIQNPDRDLFLIAYDSSFENGASVLIPQGRIHEDITLVVGPTVRLNMRIDRPAISVGSIGLSITAIFPKGKRDVMRVTTYSDADGLEHKRGEVPPNPGFPVSLMLPKGEYSISIMADQVRTVTRTLSVKANVTEPIDWGQIRLEPRKVAYLVGKKAPRICVTDSTTGEEFDLADLHGKYVLIEFWGYWCTPCIGDSLPELVAFQKSDRRKKLNVEVISVHCSQDVKSHEDYRRVVVPIVSKIWGGSELPFPVLIDGELCTKKQWSIESFPTLVLVDTDGVVKMTGTLSQILRYLDERSGKEE